MSHDRLGGLWRGEATVWTGEDEARWLGWLRVTEDRAALAELAAPFGPDRLDPPCDDVLLLGMGGSSLCPDVLRTTSGPQPGAPVLHVLDSTDPSQIRATVEPLAPARTLVIVSSKSGTTLETALLNDYVFARFQAALGDGAGARFVAVTDPGSALEQLAGARGYGAIVPGIPEIGGRFSALSAFGLVPAAAMGLDVEALLRTADAMRAQCEQDDLEANPAVGLGLPLGILARQGRNKLTLGVAPGLGVFGAWVEQLVAESTGKDGVAIVPVDGEALERPDVYGPDRCFVELGLDGDSDATRDRQLDALVDAGHPVCRLTVASRQALGAEFFRWELATAVAGAVLRINPFDQPDVEASKVETRTLTEAYEAGEAWAPEPPSFVDADTGLTVYPDPSWGDTTATLEVVVRRLLDGLTPGSYLGLQAFLPMLSAHAERLTRIRQAVRAATRVATTLGFGPRFLHSTGQAHKGGPASGHFLQITCDDVQDLDVPDRRISFGRVKAAQARGDLAVLRGRGRRVLRVHLPAPVDVGLERLVATVTRVAETRASAPGAAVRDGAP